MMQWIRVADQLPPTDTPVLGSYHSWGDPAKPRVVEVLVYTGSGRWVFDNPELDGVPHQPTHWLAIPPVED